MNAIYESNLIVCQKKHILIFMFENIFPQSIKIRKKLKYMFYFFFPVVLFFFIQNAHPIKLVLIEKKNMLS